MKLIFADEAWEDYLYWPKVGRTLVVRIHALVREVTRSPFQDAGGPNR